MSKRRNGGARDTAKDIILGLEPSGPGPRRPKEGIANPPSRKSPTQTVYVQKADNGAINELQQQLQQLQRQQSELLAAEQQARRRLQASQDALSRKLATADNAASTRDLNDLRKQFNGFESKMMMLSQEMNSMRGTVDRHSNDIMAVSSDVKSRPQVDPARIANSTQQMDMKVRELQQQLMQFKQTMEAEIADRIRVNQAQAENINRLQEYIRQQEANKNDIMQSLSRKGDMDQKKMNEESKKLNDRIQQVTTEVNRSTNERDQRIREEMNQKFNSLQMMVKSDIDGRTDGDRENKKKMEERMKAVNDALEGVKAAQQTDKAKNKERFQKINEALATLEHHLEIGDKKVDKIVNAEIQARKLHEKALLAKMQELEDRVNKYLDGLNKAIDDAKAGKENVKVPTLDTDALRREMEAIAADKNKMSMEGLLKLEEKMSRVQQGLTRDKREIQDKASDVISKDQFNKLKSQVNKLDQLMDDVEKAQEKVRDKLERQIPQDLNELSAKADNIKQQLNARIDQEEEERYLAIRELQEAYNKLLGRPGPAAAAAPDTQATASRREIDECKVAIKKLAESVTTVKNVLDRKLQEEVRKREQDVERLSVLIQR
ncbi:hypothetical protein QR680_002109 [Steinernema hermaphroditum]|uniref:Uncharacterized protein n=1 Tax=Steinernema hermaphroditum TaxID=289476 RepID=A0AA39H1A5_9BILA|nr:hypothetical protein QR680_002109 [Steinernema hermaphroditum]